MRISDWSSDVCSSDLNSAAHIGRGEAGACSQMACRTLWRLGELCATCGAADMAALGYARAPPRGGAMADARTVQAQDAQEPRAMSGGIIAIALSVLTGAAIIRFGRIPRSAGDVFASALLVDIGRASCGERG